eukprot:362287-Chlamydomonas_euryale.AAC.3
MTSASRHPIQLTGTPGACSHPAPSRSFVAREVRHVQPHTLPHPHLDDGCDRDMVQPRVHAH